MNNSANTSTIGDEYSTFNTSEHVNENNVSWNDFI